MTVDRDLRARSTSSGWLLLPPQEQQSQLAHEGPAPDADRQRGDEDHHGVDALPAGVRPVDVLQVEPQRELVQRQRGAGPVGDRAQAGDPVRAGADLEQPYVANQQQKQDAPDQVMDVKPARGDVVNGSNARPDEVGDGAYDPKSDQEPE